MIVGMNEIITATVRIMFAIFAFPVSFQRTTVIKPTIREILSEDDSLAYLPYTMAFESHT